MRIAVGSGRVTWEAIEVVRAGRAQLALAPKARRAVERSRAVVESALKSGRVLYGVTTGFGKLSDVHIPPERRLELQRNLILSHALPVGDPLPPGEAALVVYLRLESLASGVSGCRPALLDWLISAFNRGVIPEIRDGGSVGASGDLAPLAMIGATMLGEGRAWVRGRLVKPRMKPYAFAEKEALSLINGTQLTTARLCSAILDARTLTRTADVVGAMTIEALRGSARPFDARIAKAKPHPGVEDVCRNVTALMRGSGILESHRDCPVVQDAYSLRCMPQVHGAVRDTLAWASETAMREARSAVDNPLVWADGTVISAGNFHAQHVAIAADALGAAVTTLGNIVERRIERLTNPHLSNLPPFLVEESGIHSGLMMLQIAGAALAAENRTLAYPASVTTIPTTAAKEDHVSMGPIAAKHLRRIVDNTATLLAFEAICAAQGLEFLKPLRPSRAVEGAVKALRRRIAPLEGDRLLGPDVEAARALVVEGTLVAEAERFAGGLR